MNRIEASYKDPSGFVFTHNEEIFRVVNFCYKSDYDLLISSGLYEILIEKNYLVSHFEDDTVKYDNRNVYKIIKPKKVPFITYPYEWSFSQLKDAALLTLKIQMIALRYKMILKDANAYNIQFIEGKPIFIDTLSFTKYEDGEPWVAYQQFSKHFLSPLILMAYKDLRLNSLISSNIDGIPIDLVNKILPLSVKLKPFIFLNICMQAKFQKKYEKIDFVKNEKLKIKKFQLISMNKQLQDGIRKLKFPIKDSEWGQYYTFTNYTDYSFQHKKEIITLFISRINPKMIWDLGANDGFFTRIASEKKNINSIAFDIDPIACEKNYNKIKQDNEKNILPVLFDLVNPSPSIGFSNLERLNLDGRDKPDVVMALALIHHLVISNNIPFDNICRCFVKYSKYLIIEFVPKSDSQVIKLLSTRDDIFDDYNQIYFEEIFNEYYKILDVVEIRESNRALYLMERKND